MTHKLFTPVNPGFLKVGHKPCLRVGKLPEILEWIGAKSLPNTDDYNGIYQDDESSGGEYSKSENPSDIEDATKTDTSFFGKRLPASSIPVQQILEKNQKLEG